MFGQPSHAGDESRARREASVVALNGLLEATRADVHRDRGRRLRGKRPAPTVARDQLADPVQIKLDRPLLGAAAAPEPKADVRPQRIHIGQREVDDADRRRRLAVGEDVMCGEVSVDDMPVRLCPIASRSAATASSQPRTSSPAALADSVSTG